MGSKTKIIVLHMKEIIYTAIFAALGILLILLLIIMFHPKEHSGNSDCRNYTPGIYTSSLTLNDANLEVEVSVDADSIQSIRFSNLDDTVTTMFPLLQPSMESIADQICQTQSLEQINLPENSPYTSRLILDAVKKAVEKAAVH